MYIKKYNISIDNSSNYNILHNKHNNHNNKYNRDNVVYYFLGSLLILFFCIIYCKTCINCKFLFNRRINNIRENNNYSESREISIKSK